MDLKKRVWEMVEQFLPNESIFLVEIKISSKNASHIRVILDGDEGVSIEQCASISRQLGHQLEEEEVIDHAYTLEVSSPGFDLPLLLKRQYYSRIGRRVELVVHEGDNVKGELLAVNEADVQIAKEKKVKKKVTTEEVTVGLDSIKEINVLVSFK